MILTFVEHRDGLVADTSLQALTLARGIAATGQEPLDAVVLGAGADETADRMRDAGADHVHVCHGELLDDYAPEAWAEALYALVAELRPTALVASGTARGDEVLAHVAARMGAPLATACTEINPDGQDWSLLRLRWGGILVEEARLSAPVKLATVAPHVHPAVPADVPGEATVCKHAQELPEALGRTRVVGRAAQAEGVTLATAPVVVSGGRGVGSAEGFAALEELAELVGGAVGCSRVATSNGWRPHADQVGQTGTRVAPDLYIACGISGATQHWVGCMNAGRILAINTDPEAPMVTRADHAVIGDVHEVLPAVLEEIRSRKSAAVGA